MRLLEPVLPALAWKVYLSQEFFLRVLALSGHLFGNGKNAFDDFEAIVTESPALHLQGFCQFHHLFDREHLKARPRHLERGRGSSVACTRLKVPSQEMAIDKAG